MNNVFCGLYICNYLDNKTHIAHWRDVDDKTLIERAEKLRRTLIDITPDVSIKYEEYKDNEFGGRVLYTATIIVS